MRVLVRLFFTTFCFFLLTILSAQRPFITTWQTDLPGVSEDNQILIRGTGSGYTIEWEEVGNPGNTGIETGNGETLITFPHSGIYRVSISGNFRAIRFDRVNLDDKEKLISIDQWGDIRWNTMEDAFYGCKNMTSPANDRPDLSRVANMQRMFQGCVLFNAPIGHWDLSNVTNIANMFDGCSSFNQPIGDWDVSNVERMDGLFSGAVNFNQNINGWDVSNVWAMPRMFATAESFNQPIGDWDVSNVEIMDALFAGAINFNQNINGWDVSNVQFMDGMFGLAESFNQPLDNWDVS